MKLTLLVTSLFFTMSAFATINCYEIDYQSETKIVDGHEVTIEFVKDLSDHPEADDFDYISKTIVSIHKKTKGKKQLLKSFTAVAKKADVNYQIEKGDFRFWRFLDEENEDGFSMTVNGRSESYNLHCDEK